MPERDDDPPDLPPSEAETEEARPSEAGAPGALPPEEETSDTEADEDEDEPTRVLRSPEDTTILLARVRQGDEAALNDLLADYVPRLRKVAHGRLPGFVRDLHDTVDVVQDAVLKALPHMATVEIRHEGSLYFYLRQAVMNRIIDVIRSGQRRPRHAELDDDLAASHTSPEQRAIQRQNVERYESALTRLSETQQRAVVLRMELDYTYRDVAQVLGQRTPEAARQLILRALKRLGEDIRNQALGTRLAT